MVFGSFFKKKKKQLEKGIDDVENVLKPEQRPDNDLEKINHELTAENEDRGKVKKPSFEVEESQTAELKQEDSKVSLNGEEVIQATIIEVTLNVNSELLRKAQSRGIDLSNALEQQLKRMVSGVQ